MFVRFMLVAIIGAVAAGPAFIIKKCTAEDSKCIKETAAAAIPTFAAGVPEYNIASLDPLHYDEIDASTDSLKLIVKNVTVTGLSKCKPKNIVRDIPKSQMYVRLQCEFEAVGKYEMKGKLLILSIEGNDKFRLKISKILIAADLDMGEKTGSDGKKYWDINDYKYSYEIKDKADLTFDNLFNGSEVLARTANELVSKNSNEIIKELGPPVIKLLADTIIEQVKNFFEIVAIEDLAL